MKIFFGVILLIFLTSCTNNTEETIQQEADQGVVVSQEEATVKEEMDDTQEGDDSEDNDTSSDEAIEGVTEEVAEVNKLLDKQIESLIEEETVEEVVATPTASDPQEPQTVTTSTVYNNPKGRVDMNISYVLGADGEIQSIDVTSPNYGGMPKFNTQVQKVIGMSVDEASEYYVSGSSLASSAFQSAMK